MKSFLAAALVAVSPLAGIAAPFNPTKALGFFQTADANTIESGDTIYTDSMPRPTDSIGAPSQRRNICTLGIVLDQNTALTASHCGKVGQVVTDDNGPIGVIKGFEPGKDIAVIALNGQRPVSVTPVNPALLKPGAQIWKQGHTTGHTEGTVIGDRTTVQVNGRSMRDELGINLGSFDSLAEIVDPTPSLTTVAVPTNMCVAPGDSGSAAMVGDTAVGIVSAVSGDCRSGAEVTSMVVPLD